jgi:hypothetical protein
MLFSISPKSEQYLREELWGCFKYIKIPFETLYKMPVRERKFYIERHNEAAKEENDKMEGKSNSNRTEANINAYANIEQSNLKNMGNKR